jgi:hypothetical protein
MLLRRLPFAAVLMAAPLFAQQPARTRAAAQVAPVTFDPAAYSAMRYRYIGPVGNRVSAVVGVPGDPNVYYAGAASGGIWKTTDGGVTWQSIFDDYEVSSIGSLAIARSDANIVWAGTGEPHIRSHVSVGNGIYKSTDAGRTWRRMGLEESGRISRILIHPTNPDIVYAGVQGHGYGPQRVRGVWRTRNGGQSWEQLLFVDENTGVSDMVMDPTDPNKIFVGMWQLLIRTWGRESGGPGSGLYLARDGTTFTKLQGNGLPVHTIGKIGLGIAHSTDRDGRRHSVQGPAHRQRRAVALRRRRQHLEGRELRSQSRVPPAVLHAHGGFDGQSGRGLLQLCHIQPHARRWRHESRRWGRRWWWRRRTGAGWWSSLLDARG